MKESVERDPRHAAQKLEPPGAWERYVTAALGVFRLRSIKSKMIVLALIATLLPALSMGWLSYVSNKRNLEAKLGQELQSIASQDSREVDFFLKERLYDVRVFSTSSVVTETMESLLEATPLGGVPGKQRLENYLRTVRAKFTDYEELFVVNPAGRVVATSADKPGNVELPERWDELAKADKPILGRAFRDEALGKDVMIIAEPIRSAHDRFTGILAAKLNFEGFEQILNGNAGRAVSEVAVIGRDGRVLAGIPSAAVNSVVADELFSKAGTTVEFKDARGRAVAGRLEPLQQLDGGVLAQIDQRSAYAQIARLRTITLTLVAALVVAIGLAAYLLGLTVVRPLDRLARGSAMVAGGDLMIALPVLGEGEVAYLTDVFNDMVLRLARSREELAATNEALRATNVELARLSTTDSLTGLHNRHSLMQMLSREFERSARHKHPFALVMIDVDHFKRFNDTHGHVAGDDALRAVAKLLTRSIRSCDFVARYGGEEFVVLLPETKLDRALQVAERFRRDVEDAGPASVGDLTGVTLSAGVAAYDENVGDPETLLRDADAALYEAKRAGRNRVVAASASRTVPTAS